MRVPLLGKMMALLLTVAVVPLMIVGALSIRRGTDAVEDIAEDQIELVAATTASRLDEVFRQAQRLQTVIAATETIVKALAAPPARRKGLLPGVDGWLRQVLEQDPDIALAYLADEQGICVVSTSPDMVGRDYRKTRDYMRRALAGENVISDLAVGITTREPGVFLAGPVKAKDGKLLGVIVLKMKSAIIDRVRLDVGSQISEGTAFVIDANEVIISHQDPKLLYHSIGALPPGAADRIDAKLQYGVDRVESTGVEDIPQAIRKGLEHGAVRGMGTDGFLRVAGFARMTVRPWTVVVVQPMAKFELPITVLAGALRWWTIAIALFSAVCAAWITYSLLRPVKSLSNAAAKAADGDWSARADARSNDELGDLAHVFNTMMPALQERSRIQQDLHIAREIQMGMLPHGFAALEEAYDVEFGSVLVPAREVGGDLYGVSADTPDRLVVFLGDVSGKGIPASMFMVRAVSMARLLSRDIVEPERILARLNDELAVDNPSGMFVTFLCAVYEPALRRLVMANAGHCRPVLLREGAPPSWAVKNLGTALGFETGITFERTELVLRPGDALVFYTDGVTEAFNVQQECYGNDRFLSDSGEFAGKSATDITAGLHQKVLAFAGSAPQSDDIAILTLKIGAGKTATGGAQVVLELHATPEEVMRGVSSLQRYCEGLRTSDQVRFSMALAVEECCSNIVNHALQRDAQKTFRIVFSQTGSDLVVELRDRGPVFDQTQASPEVRKGPDGEQLPGGWGISLARRSVDEISYRREGDENVLRLVKRLRSAMG